MGSNKGVALIITLWVLVLLSVLALGFSSSVRRGNRSVINFVDDTRLHFSALSAYEEALHWLASDPDPTIDYSDKEGFFRTDTERDPITGKKTLDGTLIEITVTDEEARLSLNILNEHAFNELLNLVGVPEEKTHFLLDSFMDWRDKDDLHHMNGAEDDYYEPLGYTAKNSTFDSTEELLLVKDFSMDILYGNKKSNPLMPLISAWGKGININTAPPEILSIMGVSSKAIESIMSARGTDTPLKNVPHGLSRYGKVNSSFYRIVIKASSSESPWTVVLTAIVARQKGPKGEELKPVYWKEERETRST